MKKYVFLFSLLIVIITNIKLFDKSFAQDIIAPRDGTEVVVPPILEENVSETVDNTTPCDNGHESGCSCDECQEDPGLTGSITHSEPCKPGGTDPNCTEPAPTVVLYEDC